MKYAGFESDYITELEERVKDLETTLSIGSKSSYKKIEQQAGRIKELIDEVGEYEEDYDKKKKRIQELEAENAELKKQVTQRGARMQKMWEIADKYDVSLPEAHCWFDDDGVPR